MTVSGVAQEGMRDRRETEGPTRQTPRGQHGPGRTPKAATGGANDTGYECRHKHAARGTERVAGSGGEWVLATSRWAAFRARK